MLEFAALIAHRKTLLHVVVVFPTLLLLQFFLIRQDISFPRRTPILKRDLLKQDAPPAQMTQFPLCIELTGPSIFAHVVPCLKMRASPDFTRPTSGRDERATNNQQKCDVLLQFKVKSHDSILPRYV